jgi:hypothetical protein
MPIIAFHGASHKLAPENVEHFSQENKLAGFMP